MSEQLQNIEFVFAQDLDLNNFDQLQKEEPFSEKAISFLNTLAIHLKNDPRANNFPEILTFAFFCRKANLLHLAKTYYPEKNRRIGRGVVFHITPSNMPMNFAYSLVSGILSGNLNIVRLPSKQFKQIDIICDSIKSISKQLEFRSYTKRILIVRYDKEGAATAYFSARCDARMIWGGDQTVQQIKKNAIPDRSIDITFADKYSICIINADTYIHESYPERLAQLFFNDTFLFDQNACTSPHLIVWLGSNDNVLNSKKIFWNNLYDLTKKRYKLQPHAAIDKLVSFYEQVIHLNNMRLTAMPDNLIWRIELNELTKEIEKFRCNCGYFVEYTASSLLDLSVIISKKHQTIACYGVENKDWNEFNLRNNLNVIDRLKPIGKTSEFSLTWDGFNLIDELSMPL
jgi:hypothetical protein